MCKYSKLWAWIKENGKDSYKLTFAEIGQIAGVPLNHSFLKYKKELQEFGYQVSKISMKTNTLSIIKV